MKTLLLSAGLLSVVSSAFAQLTVIPSSPDPRKAIDQASQILKAAQSRGDAEAERLAREKTAAPQGDPTAARAVSADQADAVARKALAEDNQKLDSSLKNASPEGRLLIAQSDSPIPARATSPDAPIARAASPDAPIGRAKSPDAPATGRAASPDAPAGKAKPVGGAKAGEGETRMDITSQGALYFDSTQSIAVFTDDVVVVHPQFHLTSDELEVFMLKEGEKNTPPPPAPVKPGEAAPAPAKAASPAEAPQQDSQIKKAIATGRKVVIQKLDENGENQVGICRHATYEGATGDIIMRDMPQVQRATNTVIATSPATYMIIKQNGQFRTFGPARTEIIQKGQKGAKPGAPGAAPAAAAAPGAPAPANTPRVARP